MDHMNCPNHLDGTYEPPTLTVDSVIFQLISNELSVLLIKRTTEPFRGKWALPGGYNAAGETTRKAMARILEAKCGVSMKDILLIEQLYTFDTVARDPRGHAVSVTYMGLARDLTLKTTATTENPQLFSVNNLPKLAFVLHLYNIDRMLESNPKTRTSYESCACQVYAPK